MRVVIGLAALVVACNNPSTVVSDGGGLDASSSKDGELVNVDGSHPNDASVDAVSDADGDAADTGPIADNTATCNPANVWSSGTALGIATGATFASINGTETTIAWITTSDQDVHYADRADTNSPWGTAQTITSGFQPGERVALTSNGLTLYAIGTDQRSLVAFTRSQTSDAFALSSSSTLDNINPELAALDTGATVSDLVVSPSATVMIYRYVGGSSAGLRRSQRLMPTDTWPTTSPFAVQNETAVVNGKARRPTGISVDQRALYYWDETVSAEMVGYFAYDATTMTQFVNLGARANAQVNTDCTLMYYDDGQGSLDTALHN